MRQLTFLYVTFSSSGEFSVVFNIPSSHANTISPFRHFTQEQFLVSKYSSILYASIYLQSYVLEIHI